MKRSRQITNHQRVEGILAFLHLACADYLAARVLLRSGLVLQGTILASTAVEKYFKAILMCRGNTSEGHLKRAHLRAVNNFDTRLYSSLNESFLLLLSKCYKLRYPNSVRAGFNLCLSARSILAELDDSVAKIQKRFVFGQGSRTIQTAYDGYLARKSPELFEENHVLLGKSKSDYVAGGSDHIYEMRFDASLGIIETHYQTERGQQFSNFLQPGLVPGRADSRSSLGAKVGCADLDDVEPSAG